jgi:hypothetical protein
MHRALVVLDDPNICSLGSCLLSYTYFYRHSRKELQLNDEAASLHELPITPYILSVTDDQFTVLLVVISAVVRASLSIRLINFINTRNSG